MQKTYSIMARVPEALRGPVETAAARSFITPAALLRQALCEKLQREGLLSPERGETRRIYLEDAQRADAA
jgi:short subunit dehydrogenase-like uncharacterized protein